MAKVDKTPRMMARFEGNGIKVEFKNGESLSNRKLTEMYNVAIKELRNAHTEYRRNQQQGA